MLSSRDINGLMAMMPAFATDDAVDYRSKHTVDVDRLRHGLDRMLKDGANVIATTGSFGECYTLLMDEFRTLAHEAVKITAKRAPIFVGVTSTHTREVMEKCRIAQEAGADGVLAGVPYYFPSTVENAVRFYKDIGEAFPKLNIMIYHNPALHNVTLPVSAFKEIIKNPAVIAMKDSHRKPDEYVELMKVTNGQMSVIVHQAQFAEYASLGATGFWSIDAWMGPWPQLALRDAVLAGNIDLAQQITVDISPPPGSPPANMSWRETASKIAIAISGYVNPGPLRPPFVDIPDEVVERQKARIIRWRDICAKYQSGAAAAE